MQQIPHGESNSLQQKKKLGPANPEKCHDEKEASIKFLKYTLAHNRRLKEKWVPLQELRARGSQSDATAEDKQLLHPHAPANHQLIRYHLPPHFNEFI